MSVHIVVSNLESFVSDFGDDTAWCGKVETDSDSARINPMSSARSTHGVVDVRLACRRRAQKKTVVRKSLLGDITDVPSAF
jgi:hypothetical protein